MKSIYLILIVILFTSCYQQERLSEYEIEPVAYEEAPAVLPDEDTVVEEISNRYFFIVMETATPDSLRQRFTTDVVEVDAIITPDYKARELDTAEKSLRDAEFEDTEVTFSKREFISFKTYDEASQARQLAINR